MASNSKETANAQFKKALRAQKAGQARPQYETDARIIREMTARLRALRLANEVAEKEAKLAKKPVTRRGLISA